MPVRPGIRRSSKAASYEPSLEGPQRGGPVGTDRDLVAQPRQLHLHQVAEVGLIVGEQDPQSSLTRLFHDLGPLREPWRAFGSTWTDR